MRPDAHQEEKEHWQDFMIELVSFECSLIHLFNLEIADTPLDHQQNQANE